MARPILLAALFLGWLTVYLPGGDVQGQDPDDFIVVTLHSVTIHNDADPSEAADVLLSMTGMTVDWSFAREQFWDAGAHPLRMPDSGVLRAARNGVEIPIERPIFSSPEGAMRDQLVVSVIAFSEFDRSSVFETGRQIAFGLDEMNNWIHDNLRSVCGLRGPCGSTVVAEEIRSWHPWLREDLYWWICQERFGFPNPPARCPYGPFAEFFLVKPFDEEWGVGTHRAKERVGAMTVEYSIERLKRPARDRAVQLTLDRLVIHEDGDVVGNGEIYAWVRVSENVGPAYTVKLPGAGFQRRLPASGSVDRGDGEAWEVHEVLYTSDPPSSPWLYVEVAVGDEDIGPDDRLGVYSGTFHLEDILERGIVSVSARRQGLDKGDVTIELTATVRSPRDCNENGAPDDLDLEPTTAFGAAAFYDVGNGPLAVAAGHFDGGGGLDLATVNANGTSVTVLLNRGDGTLSRQGSFATKHPVPSSIQVGDFDRDGAVDLVTGHLEGEAITILYGNGQGDFSRTDSIATGAGPISVAVTGSTIATANFDTNTVSLLENVGSEAFTRTDYEVGAGPQWVAFRGSQLAVVRPLADEVRLLFAEIYGEQDLTHDIATSTHASVERPVAVAFTDFLATANLNSNNVSVLHLAQPRFAGYSWDYDVSNQTSYAVADGPTAIATADLDGDGDHDLVTANERAALDAGVSVLSNHGFGSFAPARHYAAGDRPVSVTLADLNGDGLPEIIASVFRTDSIAVLPNISTPAYSEDVNMYGNPPGNGIPDECDVEPVPDSEICNDGIDNDGDGLVDCSDVEDCVESPYCHAEPNEPPFILKINAGGPAVMDGDTLWESDAAYLGAPTGEPFIWSAAQNSSRVFDPAPGEVYWTVRHRKHQYDFSLVPDGVYTVRVHFSDAFVGQRAMDYTIEGVQVLSGFRPGVEAGGANIVVTREFVVTVADGNGLQIEADEGVGNDVFEAAIEITAAPTFIRGDATGDAELKLTDAVRILEFLFLGGERPGCLVALDANSDDEVELTDAVAILGFLFLGNPPTLPGMGECETPTSESVLSCNESQPCER